MVRINPWVYIVLVIGIIGLLYFIVMGGIQIDSMIYSAFPLGLFIFIGIVFFGAASNALGHISARLYHAVPAKTEIFQENTCLKIICPNKMLGAAIVQKAFIGDKDARTDVENSGKIFLLKDIPDHLLEEGTYIVIGRKSGIEKLELHSET